MDTFLLRLPKPDTANTPTGAALTDGEVLRSALERVVSALPHVGMDFAVRVGQWTQREVAVSWARTQPATGSSTISTYENDDGGALAFGEVFGAPNCAAAVVAAYHSGGAPSVRALDGCFGVIIWDKRQERVIVVSDLIGQRSLRFAESREAYWFSPHETCLVAVGAASVDFDPVSALSCLVVENSLRSRSVLRDVTGLASNDVVNWQYPTGLSTSRVPLVDLSARIDARDYRSQAECRTAVVDSIVAASSSWARSATEIKCELTAGIDSRATFSCLLAANVTDKIVAITSGRSDSVDMKTAIKLAKLAGVRHEKIPPASEDPSEFLANLRLRAFTMNGETDAKRAAKPLPGWRPDNLTRVEGSSGEVFRGFYYPYFGPTGRAPDSVSKIVSILLKRRCRRFSSTPVAAPEYREQLRARLRDCFDEYQSISTNGNDLLDLFYLFERTARWSAHVRRASWSSTRNVFLVPSAIKEAYRMPAPWGTTVNVHSELVRRHFKASRLVLINGAKPIDLEGPGNWRMATRLALTVGQTVLEKVSKRLAGKPTATSIAMLFAGPLHAALSDLLTAEGSVASLTLGDAGVRRVLAEHKASYKHPALLGYAATLDAYRQLLLDVRPS